MLLIPALAIPSWPIGCDALRCGRRPRPLVRVPCSVSGYPTPFSGRASLWGRETCDKGREAWTRPEAVGVAVGLQPQPLQDTTPPAGASMVQEQRCLAGRKLGLNPEP
jgi:hypothetical protein